MTNYRATITIEMIDTDIDPATLRWGDIFETSYDGKVLNVAVEQISTKEAILDQLQEILYPLTEPRDHQWNGGDVCEAVADLLRAYRPEAQYRQKPAY